ncbi:DoxX family protein [Flavobacterium rhizosphaerae]|uniref:DoxX family protein n=1 Tax=Flavobacterium rhizosphaerae TaxID=3163298 RepID=A0ABW8YX89_9FLAO
MGTFTATINKKLTNIGLLLLRLMAGGLMLTHGWQKYQMLVAEDPIQFANPIGVGEVTTLVLAVFAELICASLLIIGFVTRLATIPLIITMFVVVFIVHANDGLMKQELGIIYLTVFIVLLLTGPGKFSVDGLIPRRKRYIFSK